MSKKVFLIITALFLAQWLVSYVWGIQYYYMEFDGDGSAMAFHNGALTYNSTSIGIPVIPNGHWKTVGVPEKIDWFPLPGIGRPDGANSFYWRLPVWMAWLTIVGVWQGVAFWRRRRRGDAS